MKIKAFRLTLILFATGAFVAGCADISSRIADRAGDKIADEITRRVLTPFRHAMIQASFGVAFFGYGAPLATDTHPYQEGEWTEWEVKTTGDMKKEDATNFSWIKKGLVKKTASGEEWWRLEVRGEDVKEASLFEALFIPKFEALTRLIAQFPNEKPEEISLDEEGPAPGAEQVGKDQEKEKPKSPMKITADTGTRTIKVPAGRFQAQKFHYSGTTKAGDRWEVTFYLSEKVPGGLVAYEVKGSSEITDESGKKRTVGGKHLLELKAYGKGLQFELLPRVK